MVKLTAKELERQGTFYSEKFQKSQVIFQEKSYTRGPDFSKNLHAKAIRFCQKYDKLNLETLIVEHPLYLAIWIQNNRVMAIAERAS